MKMKLKENKENNLSPEKINYIYNNSMIYVCKQKLISNYFSFNIKKEVLVIFQSQINLTPK